MRHVEVQTAQHVAIGYTVASVGDRILAYIIDLVILIVFIFGMLILFSITGVLTGFTRAVVIIFPVLMLLPYLLYDLLMEYFFNGQSVGKRLRKIKVVRLDGTPATLGNYLLA